MYALIRRTPDVKASRSNEVALSPASGPAPVTGHGSGHLLPASGGEAGTAGPGVKTRGIVGHVLETGGDEAAEAGHGSEGEHPAESRTARDDLRQGDGTAALRRPSAQTRFCTGPGIR
ncbi:hypothetical protein SMICM17S_06688 [Streptomyces microflavus]